GDDDDVERQTDLVALDLHVLLFHQVEETDLDLLGEVGQLVDREDATVGARHQTVVDRFLVGEVAPFGDLDGIDLADQIGDRHIRRRQLLAVAPAPIDPLDLQRLALRRLRLATGLADRLFRIVVNRTSLDDRNLRIEEGQQSPDDARLRLTTLTEEDYVV